MLAQEVQLGSPVSLNTDLESHFWPDICSFVILPLILCYKKSSYCWMEYLLTYVREKWEGEARGEKVGRVGGNLEETRVSSAST